MKSRLLPVALAACVLAVPALAQQAASPSASNQQTSQSGQGFVPGAAQNSIHEVMVSNLALSKSENPQVVNFAEMMINHHGQAAKELAKLTQDGNTAFPVMPDQEQAQVIQRLQGLSGAEFDRAFMQHQLQAHQKAVNLYQQGVQSAQDQQVQMFAQMGLPLIQAHQEIAQEFAQGGAAATGSTKHNPGTGTGSGSTGQTNR
ncbi:DUF4142 domain-containing protein [Microvirga roseola]|uniref:DUF4142 domain-containing protein n=1 Tax=Microvirga roseola TaxID=2883126 RepID=UPI001E34C0C4|nr:DUF4142 domain-containing protein [Microvirga roseola]